MSTVKLTLLGMDSWMKVNNDDLFSSLTLPAGITKTDVVNNILLEAAELECLYSDPNFCKEAIGLWGKKWYPTFEKWYNALQIEYEPLNNFDRYEEWSDSGTSSSTNTGTGNVSNSSKTTNTPSGSIVTDHYVTPYESNTKTLQSEDTESYSSYKTENDTAAESSTLTSNTGTGTTTGNHTGHLYGNIGVTTSQQMLQSELDIAYWNLTQHITDIFLKEFCLLVY